VAEVTTHVPAVRVQNIEPAVFTAEHHEFLAEGGDRVRAAIAEILDEAQAMPTASEASRRRLCFDVPNLDIGLLSHDIRCTVVDGPPALCVPLIRTQRARVGRTDLASRCDHDDR
jgi:hypothetical protein